MPVLAEYLIADISQADRADQEFVEVFLSVDDGVADLGRAVGDGKQVRGRVGVGAKYRGCSRQILVQRIEMRIQLPRAEFKSPRVWPIAPRVSLSFSG